MEPSGRSPLLGIALIGVIGFVYWLCFGEGGKMTMTISVWLIPVLLNVLILGFVLRPYKPSGMFDVGPIERVLWIVPLLLTWVVFFAFLWWAEWA